jgi:hypothetical protein
MKVDETRCASIVDQDVQLTNRLDGFCGDSTAIDISGHVALDDNGFHSEPTALGGHMLGSIDGLVTINSNITSFLG